MAKVKMKTTIKDKGHNALRAEIAKMAKTSGGPHVKVGILETAGTHEGEGGLTVADVAVFNEFGTPTIPERPFLRDTADAIRPEMNSLADKILDRIMRGKSTIDEGLDIMGLKVQSAIKAAITNWKTPPNAPSTIAKKGVDNPLVDTGQMRNSIEFQKIVAEGNFFLTGKDKLG
jgi:hypothetical protein